MIISIVYHNLHIIKREAIQRYYEEHDSMLTWPG